MAYSQSFKKGQIPINCQLCEIERKIVCKCVECNLLLCRSCIKHHSKFKNAKYHKLLDIKDIGRHRSEIDFQCIPCENHSEMCFLFCMPCDTLVCRQCEAKVHKKHDKIEIKEAYQIKQTMLASGICKVEEHIEKIDSTEAQLKNFSDKDKAKIRKIKEDVITHGKLLKQRVDEQVTKMIDDLNHTGIKINAKIRKDTKSLTKEKAVLNQKIADAEELIHTMDATRFFKNAKSMVKSLQQIEFPKTESMCQSDVEFVPQKPTNIGEIRFTNVTQSTEESTEASIIETYTTDLSGIDYILPDQNDKIWIGSYNDGVFYQAQMEDQALVLLYKRNINVWDMARLSKNKILLSVGKQTLKVLDTYTSNVTDSVFNVNPFRSLGVHVTKYCRIIIGAWAEERKAVIVFDDTGKRQAVYEQDRRKQPLFTYPRVRKLTTTSNGNIHVVDSLLTENDKRGRVIVLGRNGDIVNTYQGNTEINKEFLFSPRDIVTSLADRVVVADPDSGALHILDYTGELLTFIDKCHIYVMYSVAFLDKEHLLIGCNLPKGSNTKNANIYKLKVCGH